MALPIPPRVLRQVPLSSNLDSAKMYGADTCVLHVQPKKSTTAAVRRVDTEIKEGIHWIAILSGSASDRCPPPNRQDDSSSEGGGGCDTARRAGSTGGCSGGGGRVCLRRTAIPPVLRCGVSCCVN